jgi:hypothetical protein
LGALICTLLSFPGRVESLFPPKPPMSLRLRNLIPNAVERIQRSHRFLKNHGNFASANIAHFCAILLKFDQVNHFLAAFAMQINPGNDLPAGWIFS